MTADSLAPSCMRYVWYSSVVFKRHGRTRHDRGWLASASLVASCRCLGLLDVERFIAKMETVSEILSKVNVLAITLTLSWLIMVWDMYLASRQVKKNSSKPNVLVSFSLMEGLQIVHITAVVRTSFTEVNSKKDSLRSLFVTHCLPHN